MKQRQLNTVIDVAHSAGKTYVAQGWRMRLRKTVIASLLSVSLMMFSASSWAAIWDLSQEGGDVNCPGSKKVVLDQTEKENRISQKITTFKDSRSDVICKLSDNEKELFSASYQRKERAAITVNKINLASIKVKVALNSDFNQYLKGQKKLEKKPGANKKELRKDRNATIYVSICIPSIGRDKACTIIKKDMMFWKKKRAWNIKFPATLKKALETFIVENGFLMNDYKKSVIVNAYVTNRAGDVWYHAKQYKATIAYPMVPQSGERGEFENIKIEAENRMTSDRDELNKALISVMAAETLVSKKEAYGKAYDEFKSYNEKYRNSIFYSRIGPFSAQLKVLRSSCPNINLYNELIKDLRDYEVRLSKGDYKDEINSPVAICYKYSVVDKGDSVIKGDEMCSTLWKNFRENERSNEEKVSRLKCDAPHETVISEREDDREECRTLTLVQPSNPYTTDEVIWELKSFVVGDKTTTVLQEPTYDEESEICYLRNGRDDKPPK